MFKILIIISLISITHSYPSYSWTWNDYPFLSEKWNCHVPRPANLCDPNRMLTNEQKEEIVELIEDFNEQTKRPNSIIPCMREGLKLVVALAKIKINDDASTGQTSLCKSWSSSDKTTCESDVHGIELNENGLRYCYSASRWLMTLPREQYENLITAEIHHLNDKNYFEALKNYIINLRMLYVQSFSIFDNHVASSGDNITLSELQHSLQDTKKTISEMRDLQNKTLSAFYVEIEETNKKLSEMRQLLTQDHSLKGNNINTEGEE
ncbi:unnamed protein product [Meloidogyne enterolobii]|uniref:Uncharacterized protein n=1 Tax=Meloidogyne enterolobii TaxID=390850 RepID=A0ACB1AUP6_MELEN